MFSAKLSYSQWGFVWVCHTGVSLHAFRCDDHICCSQMRSTQNHKQNKPHGGQISNGFMQMKTSDAVDEESHYVSTPAQLIKHGRIRLEMPCEGTGEKLQQPLNRDLCSLRWSSTERGGKLNAIIVKKRWNQESHLLNSKQTSVRICVPGAQKQL